MSGNYEPFNFRFVPREMDRYRAKQEEREREADAKLARYREIENQRAVLFETVVDPAPTPKNEMTVSWSEERPAWYQAVATNVAPNFGLYGNSFVIQDGSTYYPSSGPFPDETEYRKAAEYYASLDPSLGERLSTALRILGPQLQAVLASATSFDQVVDEGPGFRLTARDVWDALGALNGYRGGIIPPSSPEQQFVASSEDGRRVVLSGKEGLDTGIIYDPANRPVRKFRLHETAA